MIKIQLVSQKLGTVNLHTDPGALDKLEEQIKRSSDNDGVIYSFSTAITFNKIGREFLRQAYNIDGIEALVVVNVYEYNSNTYLWELSMSGKVNFTSYQKDEINVTVNLDQFNFNVSFVNQISQDVSMSLNQTQDGTPLEPMNFVTVKLQPKSILQQYQATAEQGNDYSFTFGGQVSTSTLYGIFDTQDLTLNEIDKCFGYAAIVSNNIADINILNNADPFELSGDATFGFKGTYNIKLKISGIAGGFLGANFTFDFRYRHCDKAGTILSDASFGTVVKNLPNAVVFDPRILNCDFDLDYSDTRTFVVGDTLILYYKITGVDTGANPTFYGDGGTNLNAVEVVTITGYVFIRQNTIYPETTCQAVMAYELLERLSQYYTNQTKCFKSTALGRVDLPIPYGEDGYAALTAFTNGQLIRQRTGQQLFFNFKEVMQFLSAAFGLSWGFETQQDGSQMVVVEKFSYFFDKTKLIYRLGEVPKVITKVYINNYAAKIKAGYRDIKLIKQLNAVDEFNQGRQFNTSLTQVSNELDLSAGQLSASGYEIESQRRQSVNTQDSSLDADRFGICVLRDGAPVMGIQGWKNERAESFTDITGLYDPATAYNLRIRPSKGVRQWATKLSSNLIYGLNKLIKFSSGTGNYNLVCKGTDDNAAFAESDPINLAGETPLYYNETYEFDWPITKEAFALAKKDSLGYIEFLDKGVLKAGFILSVSSNRTTKSTKHQLLRAL